MFTCDSVLWRGPKHSQKLLSSQPAPGVTDGVETSQTLCSCPPQWLTAASRPQRRAQCSCQSQGPCTAAWPCLPVSKALLGREETTALCVVTMAGGRDPAWCVKVTDPQQSKPVTLSLFLFLDVNLDGYEWYSNDFLMLMVIQRIHHSTRLQSYWLFMFSLH